MSSKSWKYKVDPAFDKLIKIYLNFLKVVQLPGNEGYITVDERNLKILETEGFPSLASVYEHDKTTDTIIDFGYLVGEPITEKEIREIAKEVKTKKINIFHIMMEISETMEQESRKYYEAAFKHFVSEEAYSRYISDKDKEQIKDIAERVTSDGRSFWFNYLMIPLEDAKEEIKKSIEARHIKASTRMIKRNLFYTWDAVSLLVNGASLRELSKKAKEGDDKSLFKIVKIDKTFFDHKWVRTRMNKAAYSADWSFFEALGKAIKADPLGHKRNIAELFLVLRFFWYFGLYRLSDADIHELMIDSGLNVQDNVETFGKYLRRNKTYLPK
jgi:hypothetical protein